MNHQGYRWGAWLMLLCPLLLLPLTTQDGPSHVWQALALNHLAAGDPAWTAIAEPNHPLLSNQLIHRVLQVLLALGATGPMAEKILQLLLALPFAAAIYWATGRRQKHPELAAWVPVFFFNLLFFKGFYNFIAAAGLALLAFRLLQLRPSSLWIHLLWPALYFAHPLGLAFVGLAALLLYASGFVQAKPTYFQNSAKARLPFLSLAHGAFWALVFGYTWFASGSSGDAASAPRAVPILERLARLALGDVLALRLDLRLLLTCVLTLAVGVAAAVPLRLPHFRRFSWILWCMVFFAAAWAILGPDHLGEGGFVRQRMAWTATVLVWSVAVFRNELLPPLAKRVLSVLPAIALVLVVWQMNDAYRQDPSARANFKLHEADRIAVQKDTLQPDNYALRTHHFPVRAK